MRLPWSAEGKNIHQYLCADMNQYDIWRDKNSNPNPLFKGFSRCLINECGEEWSMLRVLDQGKYAPTVGFMRNDGWTIGAPEYLEHICFDLYPQYWTHFIKMPSNVWRPISEYK